MPKAAAKRSRGAAVVGAQRNHGSLAYRYGDKLGSVTSDFPSEGTVAYEYGGDQKRRERSVSGGDYTWYNWDIGWNVINEENSNCTLSMTYTMDSPAAQVAGVLADASTTNPATGTYRYYSHDNLGSTRRLRASDKSSLGAYEYTPYGQAYATSGVALGDLGGAFTGKAWDDTSQLYYFPYRYYSPEAARWLTRDPLGMVDGPNVYAYVVSNPINAIDELGLRFGYRGWKACMIDCEGIILGLCLAFCWGAGVATVICAIVLSIGCAGYCLLTGDNYSCR